MQDKSLLRFSVLFATSVAFSVFALRVVTAQDFLVDTSAPKQPTAAVGRGADQMRIFQLHYGLTNPSLVEPRQKLDRVLRKSVSTLRDSDSNEDKAEAREIIRTAIADYFDQDMKHREAELAALKARLEKLTQQLKVRRESKDMIVDHQAKTIELEATGLGLLEHSRAEGTLSASGNEAQSIWTSEERPRDEFRKEPIVRQPLRVGKQRCFHSMHDARPCDS